MSNEFINIGSANSSPEQFQLRYISISKYEGDWQSLPHTHHFSELFYVLRGEGAFYIENEKVPVKTDDLVIINPYVEHTEKTLPNDPMEYIVFGVEGLAFSFSGAGSARHNIRIYVYGVNGVTYCNLVVQTEYLLNIAAVTFCSVRYKDLVRCNVTASCLIIILCNGIAQEFITKVGSVTMKSLRFSHLIHCTVQRINDSGCQRLCHVTDAQTDDLLVRVCCGIRTYLFADGGK